MPGETFAFLGLFESKPTKAEMEISPAAVARIASCGVAERKVPAERELREALERSR